jgi:hypothetical protein
MLMLPRPRRAWLAALAVVLISACAERTIVEQESLSLEEHCELYCEAQDECTEPHSQSDPCFDPCLFLREQRPWESEGCYNRQRAYQACIVEHGCAGWDDPECDALGRAIDCEPAPDDDD